LSSAIRTDFFGASLGAGEEVADPPMVNSPNGFSSLNRTPFLVEISGAGEPGLEEFMISLNMVSSKVVSITGCKFRIDIRLPTPKRARELLSRFTLAGWNAYGKRRIIK